MSGAAALPELPPPVSDAPSVLGLGMTKGGSTLLFDIMLSLAAPAGLVYFSLPDLMFRRGVREAEVPPGAARLFLPRGYCYGGFRALPRHPLPILDTARTVLLVRDPRDMLVSLYYSVAYSHVIPGGEETGGEHYLEAERRRAAAAALSEFVRGRAEVYRAVFADYLRAGVPDRPNVKMFRYEDVIYRKRDWVAELCDWFGWEIGPPLRHMVADRFDILPENPDPRAHVRQVHPGNHRAALSAADIAFLDETLAEPLRRFGYSEGVAAPRR